MCWVVGLFNGYWGHWFIDWLVWRLVVLCFTRALRTLLCGIMAASGRPDQHYTSRARARQTCYRQECEPGSPRFDSCRMCFCCACVCSSRARYKKSFFIVIIDPRGPSDVIEVCVGLVCGFCPFRLPAAESYPRYLLLLLYIYIYIYMAQNCEHVIRQRLRSLCQTKIFSQEKDNVVTVWMRVCMCVCACPRLSIPSLSHHHSLYMSMCMYIYIYT